ncbi:MAG: hypothetical protein U0K86_04310 [Agathobacter sp.]|nr:hypothetical protein [Agathobacter sp.]
MSTEQLEIITNICFLLALVFLCMSIILFFLLDILSIVREMTGKNAKKQVDEIREQRRRLRERQKNVTDFKPSSVAVARKIYEEKKEVLEEETVLLEEETTILLSEKNRLVVYEEIMEIHTDESIEI